MERIQKVLASAGLASRREIESWIKAGRISINGQLAVLGSKVRPSDKVTLDGKPIKIPSKHAVQTRVLIYNKPEGEICSRRDPENRPTVFDHLPTLKEGRWIAIGRLDINTMGLLLFTNNGELANRLMHPSYEITREYAVRILGKVEQPIIRQLLKGVELEDGLAKFDDVTLSGGSGANVWYHVTLREGRNREIRRLWESQGVTVSRLIRVSFGNVRLPRDLPRGQFRELELIQRNQLIAAVGLAPETDKKSPQNKKVRRW